MAPDIIERLKAST